ncbi:MAG: DUF1415 domain-containing protein [Burkholderiales bacterium]
MKAERAPTANDEIIVATRTWLERAVIGLNLCPFAKAVHVHNRIRYCVSGAQSTAALLDDLLSELRTLKAAAPDEYETTLLIHPYVLTEFIEYNHFLRTAEATVAKLGLDVEFQIASFHPHYQFADAGPEDIENYTNRSPYPTLHLLREASIARAVAAFPDAAAIYEKNIETLRRLGHAGWQRLWLTDEEAG